MNDENHYRTLPDGSVLHAPPNTLLTIDRLWAFISVDEDGNEGLCAAPITIDGASMTLPLIAADEARLQDLTPIAAELSRVSGMRIKLISLSERTQLDEWPSRRAFNQGDST